MDAVNAFNLELFSMIDMKPPISRAKMMSVTKSAIKAIKLYKHVVQIVEKFIKRCKPELKVPGLYVVDSIVRQSRHQFGVDKDVFGPRFLKNFADTFQNLYLCPADDKTKIARVLNLWQKNGVFEMDIIQPLLDMATGSFVPNIMTGSAVGGLPATQAEPQPPVTSASLAAALPQLPNPDALAAVAQLFQSSQGQELQKMLQNFQQADRPQAPLVPNTIPSDFQRSASQHIPHSAPSAEQKPSLAKKLLDRFDYDDEPEDVRKNDMNPVVHTPLGPPGSVYGQYPGQMPNVEHFQPQMMGHSNVSGNQHYGALMQHPSGYPPMSDAYAQQSQGHASLRREGRHREHSRRSRSRSGSRSPRRRRSRSTSRSRRSRQRRSRSPSSEPRWNSPGSRSQERSEREKERERKQKGLPSFKSQTLSVCSTTLWVGQLDKKTQQQDVMSLLEEFGQIESINMIPPRGCAYIVMVHRQDAYRALHKLSRGSFKVNGKPIKIAWALNKGIKTVYKKLWDVDRGVTYIPWSKVKVEELESFKQGGMLDAETLNPEWSDAVKDLKKPGVNNGALEGQQTDGPLTAHVQSIGGPATFPGPMVLSPPSILPGAPPGFLPTTFDPTQMPPGFPPPAMGVRNATEDSCKDGAGGNGSSSDVSSDNQLGSPVAPMMSPPGPAGLLGPRAGMLPMQRPPGMPPPHLRPFLLPPNMQPMPPQMMPGGLNPMFPREPLPRAFRMPMPHHPMEDFPPHGPPFPPGLPVGPEDGGDREGRHFRNERPGFGRDRDPGPFGGNSWPRDGPERRGRFMGRPDRY